MQAAKVGMKAAVQTISEAPGPNEGNNIAAATQVPEAAYLPWNNQHSTGKPKISIMIY